MNKGRSRYDNPLGLSWNTVCNRIRRGWSEERAKTTPLKNKGIRGKQTKEYSVWFGMIQRCYNPDATYYEEYGLDGIKVCGRWKGTDGFENFFKDMGERPADGYQLDRIDPDYGYSSWNCRWVTVRENILNRNFTHWITFNGETLCLKDWAIKLNINIHTLWSRIKRGWSIERALTTKTRRYNRADI